MDLEVLIFVLTLILALEPFKVFQVLLFESEFEVFEFNNLLLVVVDGLAHSIFFTLYYVQLHFYRLLDI